MNIADRIKGASTSGGGNWFKPGKGVLIVREVKVREEGFKGTSLIAEFMVESSQAVLAGQEPNLAGTSVSKVETLKGDKEKDPSALGRFKSMLIAFTGLSETEAPKEDFDKEFDEVLSNPIARQGTRVAYETRQVTTKAGKEITAVNFIPIRDQTEAMVADGKSKLTALPVSA